MYHHRCCKWLPPASINSCACLIMLRYTRCNIVILMAATAWLMLCFSSCIVCGFDSYTVFFKFLPPPPREEGRNFLWGHLDSTVYKSNPHTIQELKDIISHAVAAITITTLHPVYHNMVTAQLLANCSNTLRNIYTNVLTPERITGHVQNGRRATFLWPILYIACLPCFLDDYYYN